jgi:hypothetical protein
MAVLWSLWSSDSIADWVGLLGVVQPNLADIATLLLTFLAISVLFGLTLWVAARTERRAGPSAKHAPFFRPALVTSGALTLLLIIGHPRVYGQLGGRAQALIGDLTVNRLSDVEATLLQRGYYEDLVGVSRFNSELWEIYTKRPSDWPTIMETEVARQTGDNLIVELVPSKTITFLGAQLSTNRWGMRDRDYEQSPAPGTYRIALTGPSFVMGSGVADEEVFEWLLEDRLNREYPDVPYTRYEILNFAVPGYSALQELISLEHKGLSFQPNALFFVAHQREEEAVVRYLADRISVGAAFPYADLIELTRQKGVAAGLTKAETERRLYPLGTDILSWTYRRLVAVARAHGVLPVYIFMPTLENPLRADEVAHLIRLAEEAGFIVLDLSDAYANQEEASIVVAYWDKHPNAKGHRLIAERLYQALWEKKEQIPLFP